MTNLVFSIALRYTSLGMVRLGSRISPGFISVSSVTHLSISNKNKTYLSRGFTTSKTLFSNDEIAKLDSFTAADNKSKDTYLDLLHFYKNRDIYRRGHVEFIYAALKHMEEFGVNKDLETYKALMDCMPKGKFVPRNTIQKEFQHFPKQQQCIIDLLEQMEVNGVIPDEDMEDILTNLFGRGSHAMKRYWRMMYWMPKLGNLSPWPVPRDVPDDSLVLAKLAIQRITSVDPSTEITVFDTKDVEDAIDKTWIVSGQSQTQVELIQQHDKRKSLFIEGSFRVWLREKSVNYFILRADPMPPGPQEDYDDVSKIQMPLFSQPTEAQIANKDTVHRQEDSTILAVCATGTSSRDSLLSWVRLLQREVPRLGELQIVFTLKSPLGVTEPPKEIEGGDSPVPEMVVNPHPS